MSVVARKARLPRPYLLWPNLRGRWFTATSTRRKPAPFTSAGMKRCMPLNGNSATGILQTRVDGGALPGVAFESEHANPRIARDPLRRPICRAVIDENYLVIDAAERRGQLALEERHIFFLVKERHHHGHRGRTLAHSGSVRYFRQRNTCHSRIFVPNRVTSMVAIRSTDSKPARMLCGTTIPLPLWT